ncbi:MAG: aminotransferase class I/II-fold pyridoxal phosphate-dependent enzyme [Planctomycetes bacterium]|nr:aminotransferase class I/II-fold pyridoxal phosphate-dependent enzyme [Planctomycetota bacterium]MBU4399929.1 aminotransferase class I/II-fold pyridoxal phosphate-dependent enzyme [Planctomycetota bacterium]MCG2685283.1 aminotransferase class I/II-fold pyridoxal phosphate-dependent enzyme [Planctomycetales bacterium]
MSANKLEKVLTESVEERRAKGTLKGAEVVITGVKYPTGQKGYRYLLEGFGDKEFLKMNANAYLGMPLRPEIIAAEEEACRKYGAGPGAVRFINGTFKPHVELEKGLARFHKREAAMIFSSAYATMIGAFPPLISAESALVSDELNHNCIINAIRLSRPQVKEIYKHLDVADMEERIKKNIGVVKRVIIVTDGIFSMRGDCAPLDKIAEIARKYDDHFPEGTTIIVDDSHGVGAFGKTGRGVEEYTNAKGIHVLIGTLGKAFGVNGGYIAASAAIINYLRETAATYIYSNPITPSEAAAALKSLEILDGPEGLKLLEKLRGLTRRFEKGLVEMDFEIIASEHPVVPLMVRDTQRTAELVKFLFDNGVLATGLNFPVVPRGDEEIRFQVSAAHTEYDIDYALGVLKKDRDSRR